MLSRTSRSGNAFSFNPSPAPREQAAGTGQGPQQAIRHWGDKRRRCGQPAGWVAHLRHQRQLGAKVEQPYAAGVQPIYHYAPAGRLNCRVEVEGQAGGKGGSTVLLVVAVWWDVSSGCTAGKGQGRDMTGEAGRALQGYDENSKG